MVGVRYHNGLVQALGHKDWNVLESIWEELRESFSGGRSSGERWFPPRLMDGGGGGVKHSELVGAASL